MEPHAIVSTVCVWRASVATASLEYVMHGACFVVGYILVLCTPQVWVACVI